MITDAQAKEVARSIAVKLGRAIALSVVAANVGPSSPNHVNPSMEDRAIAAMDQAWSDLADIALAFLEDD